jgi:diguanylate cyclase (GGDEF)-like protein
MNDAATAPEWRDELTGLLSLAAWTEQIIAELARARRSGHELSVVLLDIDDFGLFREAFGAEAGDELLRDVGHAWRDCTRPYDLLARLGRDEFALALPETSGTDALSVCHRFRDAMPSGHSFSAGVAVSDDVEGIDELVDRAEAALEAAKQSGRGNMIAV